MKYRFLGLRFQTILNMAPSTYGSSLKELQIPDKVVTNLLAVPCASLFSSFSFYALDGQLSPSQTPSSSYHFLTLVHLNISSR